MLSCKKWLFIKEEDPAAALLLFFAFVSPLFHFSPLLSEPFINLDDDSEAEEKGFTFSKLFISAKWKRPQATFVERYKQETGEDEKKPTLVILLSSFLLICYLSLFPLNFSGEFQLENIRSSGNKPIGFATTQKLPVENKFSQIHKWTNEKYTNEKYTNTQIKNTEIQATKK